MKLKYILKDLKTLEVRLLILTIFISILCVSSISFLTQGIKAGLQDSTGEFLGGDRVLNSPSPINTEILQKAKSLGLQSSENVIFYSMLVKNKPDDNRQGDGTRDENRTSDDARDNNTRDENREGENNEFALAEVKAVDAQYPLKGELRSANSLYGEDEADKKIPDPGTVWLEANLFSLLNVSVGDSIYIGYLPLKVTRILTFEPDRGSEGFTLAPRALINLEDLPKTQVIAAGSRQNYKLLMTGSPDALMLFENWLKPQLTATQKWTNVKDARPVVKTLLDQTENYLLLIVILNVLVAALAISQAARRFAWRKYPFIAILRCFGAGYRWIWGYFILELLVYNFIATLFGYLLGAILFYFSKDFFEQLLTQNIMILWQKPFYIAITTGLLLSLVFVLPTLYKLKKVSPLWIFRQRRGRVESGLVSNSSGWKRLLGQWAGSYGVELRYGVNNLLRYPFENSIQILAFALVMICAWLLFFLRTDLLDTWHQKIKRNAPNYFAINIFQDKANSFKTILDKYHVKTEKFYPIIRGRLLTINNEILESEERNTQGKTQLRRLLNLTYDSELPIDNEIIAGQWFSSLDVGRPVVSVEQGFAERMNIKLNNRLKFQIEGKELEVQVISIRKVIWDTFHPNFFVIFPPNVLDTMPFTYMTSFYLPREQRFILRSLVREFPEINLIDMNLILKNVGNMILKVSYSIEYLWLLTSIMAFLLLFCTLFVNLEERRDNAILFRALGVSRKKLWPILFSEFLILGGLSGLIAISVASIIYLYIGVHIFNLPVKIQPWHFLLGPLIGMFIISLGAYMGLKKVFMISPAMALTRR